MFPISAQRAPLMRNDVSVLPTFSLSPVDAQKLLAEDEELRRRGEKTLRFGLPVHVKIDVWSRGLHQQIENTEVCRFRIQSGKALSLNLIFSEFDLPDDGRVFIYNSQNNVVAGPFQKDDAQPDGSFGTLPYPGEDLVIEYNGPLNNDASLKISYVIHGYRDLDKELRSFGESGSCNINVNCAEGNPWRDQISSVVMLLTSNNSRYCTGALINNTSQDGTPFVLTANHCEPGPNDIFLFNYQSAGCTNSDGSTNQSIQGCIVRARSANTDFCLLELNRIPPLSFNAFYSGWERSPLPPSSGTVIHHPSGDIKKLAFDDDPSEAGVFLGAVCWKVNEYELGTTESGSSGCPMYNSQKRIVGQLYGGEASCEESILDFYGKFHLSWDGSSPSRRLKDWLDPRGLNQMYIDGTPANFSQKQYDARLVSVQDLEDEYCEIRPVVPRVSVRNMGSTAITAMQLNWTLNEGEVQSTNWSGLLDINSNVLVNLPELNHGAGEYSLKVWINSLSPQPDQNNLNDTIVRSFRVKEGYVFHLEINTDEQSLETGFTISDSDENEVYSLSPGSLANYRSYRYDFCLPQGCYTLKMIDTGNNGLCCNYGTGNYRLVSPFGSVIAQGSSFDAEHISEFCFDSTLSVNGKSIQFVNIFPNPASEFVVVQADQPTFLHIYDTGGRLIYQLNEEVLEQQISLSGFRNGLYLLVWKGGTSRFVVNKSDN